MGLCNPSCSRFYSVYHSALDFTEGDARNSVLRGSSLNHIPPHPFREVLHGIRQLELRLEAEAALGPAQISMMVTVR
jgi:hypothetical protein